MFRRLTRLYQDRTISDRLRAPALWVVQALFMLLYAGGFIAQILAGAGTDLVQLGGFIFLGLSFALLMSKHLRPAIWVMIITITVASIVTVFVQSFGASSQVSVAVMNAVSLILLVVLFFDSRQMIYGFSLLVLAEVIASIVLSRRILVQEVDAISSATDWQASVTTDQVTAVIYLIILTAEVLLIYRNIRRTLEHSELQRELLVTRQQSSQQLINSTSKFFDLSDDLNLAVAGSIDVVTQISANVRSIHQKLDGLKQNLDSMHQAVGHTESSFGQLKHSAQDQMSHVTQSSAAIEEMVASINNVGVIVDQRQKNAQRLQDTAETGARSLNEAANASMEVLESIGKINEMIAIISSIASQTNLLAMNAAIEAAHAGDAGRGFAVVADEIRKLAESSADNAKKIKANLKTLIEGIEGSNKIVQSSAESFAQITRDVQTVLDALREINQSTQELSAGSKEILESTQVLNNTTQNLDETLHRVEEDQQNIESAMGEIANSSGSVEETALNINTSAEGISAALEQIRQIAESMERQGQELKESIEDATRG